MTQGAKQSATLLILLDDPSATNQMKVLLLKRSAHSRFLPNALVFPGGGAEDSDLDYARQYLSQPTLQRSTDNWLEWGFPTAEAAQRSLGTALRETYEECGLRIMTDSELSFDAPRCVAHWLTPFALKRRFDTYFWGIMIRPPVSPLTVDTVEVSEAQWWNPAEALRAYYSGTLELPVPTLITLCELDEIFRSPRTGEKSSIAQEALHSLYSTPRPRAIQPIIMKGEQVRLYLPGDPSYQSLATQGEQEACPQRSFWRQRRHHLIQEKVKINRSDSSTTDKATCKRWRRVIDEE